MDIVVKEARKRLKKEGLRDFSVGMAYGATRSVAYVVVKPFNTKTKHIYKKVFGKLPEKSECEDGTFIYQYAYYYVQKKFGMLGHPDFKSIKEAQKYWH